MQLLAGVSPCACVVADKSPELRLAPLVLCVKYKVYAEIRLLALWKDDVLSHLEHNFV